MAKKALPLFIGSVLTKTWLWAADRRGYLFSPICGFRLQASAAAAGVLAVSGADLKRGVFSLLEQLFFRVL